MILIPLGHEEAGVRRLPWITFGVIGICFLSLIATAGVGLESSADRELDERFDAAVEYYFTHPYLDLDPEFRDLLAPDSSGPQAEALFKAMRGPDGPDDDTRRAEQEELDRLVAGALETLGDHPYMRFGLVPGDMSLIGLITHMFMHAGWLHLIGNLLILYLAGPYIEDVWGRPMFAAFYLLAGIAAALCFVALHPGSTQPLVGASGAIAGVMGAFLVRYWKTRIRFFYMLGVFFRGTFDAPAALMLPLWLAQQLLFASMTSGEGGGIAYWAHIGGFVFGAAAAWMIRVKQIEERFVHPAIDGKVNARIIDNSAVDWALAAHDRGDGASSLRVLSRELNEHPGNEDAAMAYWTIASELERSAEAAPAMLCLIQRKLRDGDRDTALRLWGEVSEQVPGCRVDTALCLRLAEAHVAIRRDGAAAELLRRALLAAGTRLAPETALVIARLGKRIEPRAAAAAARLALQQPGFFPRCESSSSRCCLPRPSHRSGRARSCRSIDRVPPSTSTRPVARRRHHPHRMGRSRGSTRTVRGPR